MEAVRQVVLKHSPKGMDDEVKEYLADTVAALFEDAGDMESLRPDLEGVAGPLLEDYGSSPEDTSAFCERVLKSAFDGKTAVTGTAPAAGQAAGAGVREGGSGSSKADCLCYIPNLLLMYGGSPQPLLRNATLELVRGCRYGVVGANGTGKTTLMARIASKDMVGFPQEIRVVHLRHEAIFRGVAPSTQALEYVQRHNAGRNPELHAELSRALAAVGFEGEEMMGKAVGALSGGWQMRLALACAMAQKANLFLLDEPTNHLDVLAVDWLVEFINKTCVGGELGATALIVSHDADFLNRVCTHIIHFTSDARLVYHPGDFDTFKASVLHGDESKAQQLLEVSERAPHEDGGRVDPLSLSIPMADRLVFPTPERIPGAVPGKAGPVVLSLKDVSFKHERADVPVLHNINVNLTSTSRVAIVGRNGAGKSTLLSLLAGRLRPFQGELWSHGHLRLVYIAQHHESQLAEFMTCTPTEYMQLRFKRGYDKEALPPLLERRTVTASQARRIKELAKKHGKRGKEVEELISRQVGGKDGKEAIYEVKWKDLTPADNTFEKRSRLKNLGVEFLADEYDEMLAVAWGTSPERPLTMQELASHFEDFGLPEDVSCKRQLSMLSSGQRSKLMLAASFWTRPHIICLDEPTNYLDADTVEALQRALRNFRGGFAIVSHSECFVDAVSEEVWTVAEGSVSVDARACSKSVQR